MYLKKAQKKEKVMLIGKFFMLELSHHSAIKVLCR